MQCKDCGISNGRRLNYPGPRCLEHHRAVVKHRKAIKHEAHVQKTFDLRPGEYKKLYEAQGGKCALCRISTGKAKKLAVDHAHTLAGRKSLRGLLDGRCNYSLLGVFGDDPEFYEAVADYLRNPPAQKVLDV